MPSPSRKKTPAKAKPATSRPAENKSKAAKKPEKPADKGAARKPQAPAKGGAGAKAPARPAPPPAKGAAPAKPAPPAKPGTTGKTIPLPAKGVAAPTPKPLTLKSGPPKGAAVPPTGKAAAAPAGAKPGKPGAPAPAAGAPRPAPRPPAKKSGRRGIQRRGPNGELLAPGELLLPGGPQDPDEIQYFLRGCAAAEHPVVEAGVEDAMKAKKAGELEQKEQDKMKADFDRVGQSMKDRFEGGPIEQLIPSRAHVQARRNFQGVVERAKHRRREIGAFLRGLDLGRTETSHMDSHGEASLEMLMKWAAHLENLADAEEPAQADYNQFFRVLDQLESNTEALIVDVEATLRRLRDRKELAVKG